MNNLKKTAVMFLTVVMAFSMLMVPFTPITQVAPQVATPQVSTPEDVRMDLQRYLNDRGVDGPLDSVLTAYKDTGMVPSNVVVNSDGAMGALITVTPETDIATMEDIVEVNWMVDFGVATIMSAYIGSVEAVIALENHEGVVTAFADSLFKDTTTRGVEPRDTVEVAPVAPPVTQQFATTVEIGADQVVDAGIDGTGVRIGVVDTGTDFSSPDMVDAIDFGPDGLPTSYDPSGWGFGINLYRVNLTTVNETAWMGYSSWNILSYTEGGKTYIDTSTYQHNSGSPYVNYLGGLYDLDWFISAYLAGWWGNAYPNQVNLTDYYETMMRQPIQLPDPATISGGGAINITMNSTSGEWKLIPYACNGYTVQRRYDPSMRLFSPTLVVNSTKLVIDWNTTRAWTDFWNSNINWGIWDFNETATWDYYNAMGDWSFADDLAEGYYYTPDGTSAHTNLYFDYPTDGLRFGLGLLGHVWEPGIFGLDMIDGFALGGRAIGIIYDGDSHGTFVSSQIASRGITPYPIGLNGTMEYLPGVAPDSTIMGVKTVGVVSEFNSMLYTAGFDFNYGTGFWEWNYDSGHQMDITSNSWGWVTPQYGELVGYFSLIYTAVATPGFFNATHYPGVLICFSAGNSGPGAGTTTPPRAPQIIGVGASTSYHTFENSYGPGQGFDQVADFSSRGPLTLGYPKVDILAPGRNNFGLVPTYGGVFGITAGNPTAVYAGTSMACPMVAGSAALLIDAYRTNNGNANMTPDYYKTVLQSTADDTGADGISQGHGVVNVWAAYDYVVNDVGNVFFTYDSIENWAAATSEAWLADMNPYEFEGFVNTTYPPMDYADGNLYFGLVQGGSVVEMEIEGDFGTFGDWTWSAMEYVEDTTTTFIYETEIFNETTSMGHPVTKGGWFELDTELGGNYANFAASTFATITISGDQATFDDDSLWAFVFDWDDSNVTNGRIDYYNMTTGQGDELTRIQYAGGTGNVLKIDLSHPLGLSNLFPTEGIVLVHDDNIQSWPYTDGHNVTVTVTTWTLAPATGFEFNDLAGDCNVTLTVPAMDDYGIHQGYVIATGGGGTYKLPYTYSVYATYDTEGAVLELANGAGTTWTPYEPGVLTAGFDAYYAPGSSDHHSIVVDMTDSNVVFFAARAEWANADTDMDVAIVDMTGYELAHSGDSVKATDMSALAIAEVDGTTGMYIIYTTMNMIEGPAPEDYILTVVGYDALNEPVLSFSWTSRDSTTPISFATGDTIAGDHVVVNATWTDGVNPGMPEFAVTSTEIKILYGTLFYEEGPMVHATNTAQFDGVIDPDQFAWVTVPDLAAGDVARIVCDFDTSDADVMAWYASTEVGARTYANNIVDMASSDHPETDTITIEEDGDVIFGILDYAGDGGDYYLTVDTRLGLEPARVYDNTISLDTYYLLANQTYSILVDSDTGTNLRYSVETPAVTIGNFFAPVVTVPTPVATVGDADVFDITWSSTDLNVDDTTYYSLWLSNNDGVSYMLLAQNLTTTSYQWDSSGWLEGSYMVRVRAYSLDFTVVGLNDVSDPPAGYWPGDFGDGFSAAFDAGDVPPTVEPTTNETTTTTTGGGGSGDIPLDPLLIGLIGGIGVGVVIILILFLIRKK